MVLYEEIFREFQKQKVKYIVVGGIAVNLLGSLRNTNDLDIIVKIEDKNIGKIVTILKERGYKVKQPVDPMGIADKATREEWIREKHLKAFNFYKDKSLEEVDIIIDSPVSYEKAVKNREQIKAGNLTIQVVSIDDLITMKKKAARGIDIIDIIELKRIKKMRKNVNV